METTQKLHPSLLRKFYLFRKKVFKLFGGAFHAYDENGMLMLYSKQKAFKLREDFRVYSDEREAEELLTIKTPQILDIGATYNVHDPLTGQAVGALRRRAFKSIIKDEWVFLSADGAEIGKLTEAGLAVAIISRFINLIPQTYIISSNDGNQVARIKQHFNPFVLKYSMTIYDGDETIDPRLLVAAGVLLAAIEGRQQ